MRPIFEENKGPPVAMCHMQQHQIGLMLYKEINNLTGQLQANPPIPVFGMNLEVADIVQRADCPVFKDRFP